MKKIFKIISNYTEEQTEVGSIRLTKEESLRVERIIEENLFFKYDGKVCHWSNGDLMYVIMITDDKGISEMMELDNKMHRGFTTGWTKCEDITESVLYDVFDTSVFGFFENEMIYDFFVWRSQNLTKDDVLDKILKFGIDSLTKNDKLVLEDKKMILPFDLEDDENK